MRYTLHRVCEYNGWRLGYVLQAVQTAGGLELVRRTCGTSAATAVWTASARPPSARAGTGAGLPGQVLETLGGWLRDVNEVEGFPRREAAAREGLRGAIAFPC